MEVRKRKHIMVAVLLTVSVILGVVYLQSLSRAGNDMPKTVNWSMKTMRFENGWGYVIYRNEKPLIRQNRIPAIPKNKPFVSAESAKCIGEKVLEKIKAGAMPSISKSELIEMGVVDSLMNPIQGE